MMKYKIGRELILLNNLEEHIDNLENYYEDYLTGKKKNQDYNENDGTGNSLRYFLVQHLKAFDEITEKDLDDHNIIDGLKIVKLSKVFHILRNKNNFLRKNRHLSKERIFNLIDGETTSTHHRYVTHYFPGNRFAVNF